MTDLTDEEKGHVFDPSQINTDDEGYVLIADGVRLASPFTGEEIKEEDYEAAAQESTEYGLRAAHVSMAISLNDRDEASEVLDDPETDLRKLVIAQGMLLRTILLLHDADPMQEITGFINLISPKMIEEIAEELTEETGEEFSVEDVLGAKKAVPEAVERGLATEIDTEG